MVVAISELREEDSGKQNNLGWGGCINSKLGRRVPTHKPPGPSDCRTGVPQPFAFFGAATLP